MGRCLLFDAGVSMWRNLSGETCLNLIGFGGDGFGRGRRGARFGFREELFVIGTDDSSFSFGMIVSLTLADDVDACNVAFAREVGVIGWGVSTVICEVFVRCVGRVEPVRDVGSRYGRRYLVCFGCREIHVLGFFGFCNGMCS